MAAPGTVSDPAIAAFATMRTAFPQALQAIGADQPTAFDSLPAGRTGADEFSGMIANGHGAELTGQQPGDHS